MFSDVLRQLRKQKKINQATLADAIGMSQATIASWEKGTRKPDAETVAQLADYFGVTIDYLMGRDETAHQQPEPVDEQLQLFRSLLSQMNDDQRERAAEYMRFLISQRK